MGKDHRIVTIEKLVYGGHGLSRTDGRVWLTPLVLPGEEVAVEPVDKLHARLIAISKASGERVEPPCPYFGTCGGCHYQHAPYAFQVSQKVEILREVLRRVGKFEAPDDIEVVTGPEWNYRNRVQLHVRNGKIGYLRLGSHELCPVEMCPISSPRINEVIGALNEMVRDRRFPAFVRTVEVFTNETDVQINAIETERPLAKHFFDWCAETIPGYMAGAIEHSGMRVGPRSFFQVNRFLIDQLVRLALGDGKGSWGWDLYAGAGLFSRPMTERFERVTAVESGANAVADLRHNAPGVEAVRMSADEFVAEARETPDFVVVDPPREGLGKQVTRDLVRLRPSRVHIVACDPATLARDLRHFLDSGYRISKLALIDLFPQTYHLETVVHLSLA